MVQTILKNTNELFFLFIVLRVLININKYLILLNKCAHIYFDKLLLPNVLTLVTIEARESGFYFQ